MKFVPIFAGLSSIATTPFAVKFANNQINLPSGGGTRVISGGGEGLKRREQEPVKDNNQEAMKKAVEMLSNKEGGKIGCFWMPQLSSIEFFFCFNMDQLSSLFLFHFDRRGGDTWEKKLNRIEGITLKREMNFAKGENKFMNPKLKAYLAWMHKWQTTFKPSEHCQISTSEANTKNYTLACDASKVSGATTKNPWVQNIAKSDVHIPEFQNEIKN